MYGKDRSDSAVRQNHPLPEPALSAPKVARVLFRWSVPCLRPQFSQFPASTADFLLLPNLLKQFPVVVGQHRHSNLIKI
jgi:hypothetical protein